MLSCGVFIELILFLIEYCIGGVDFLKLIGVV